MERPYTTKPASNVGAKPGLCMVKIVSVHNSDPLSGYPAGANVAAALYYSGDVQSPSGPPIYFRPGQNQYITPEPLLRWPSPWIVEAFRVGQVLPAAVMDGKIYLTVAEDRWAAPCDWEPVVPPPTPPPPQFPIDPRVGNPYPGTHPIEPEIPSQ